jgi:hypothetical protein
MLRGRQSEERKAGTVMNGLHFDTIVRTLPHGSRTRRSLARSFGGVALVAAVALFAGEDADARRQCPPCRKRRRGKCKKKRPDGTACPGGTCQSGRCSPVSDTCDAAACPDPGVCKTRACADNVCAPENVPNDTSCGSSGQVCQGGVCCPFLHQNCFGTCVNLACQGSLAGGCNDTCLIPGRACCGPLSCQQTSSGLRCRP